MGLLEIFGVSESYKLPDAIMACLLSGGAAEKLTEIKAEGISSLRDYYQNEQGDRKNLKQDFTPDDICQIVAELMQDGSVLDMCAGTGALSAAAYASGHGQIHEQEFSERTIAFNLLDACLNGRECIVDQADCLRENIVKRYVVKKAEDFCTVEEVEPHEAGSFDNVIMNPPYSMTFDDADSVDFYGMKVPKSKADYGFVLNGLKHLSEGGRLIAILPHGVLFRGQREDDIRRWLIERNLIKAVIGLPDNMFLNTGIPVFLLVLQSGSNDTLFIDSQRECYKDGKSNKMRQDQIRKVIDTFNSRAEIERYSRVVSVKEIAGNDYNLNIPRYVDSTPPEPVIDMAQVMDDLERISAEELDAYRVLRSNLRLLVGNPEDMTIVNRHIGMIEHQINARTKKTKVTVAKEQLSLF